MRQRGISVKMSDFMNEHEDEKTMKLKITR